MAPYVLTAHHSIHIYQSFYIKVYLIIYRREQRERRKRRERTETGRNREKEEEKREEEKGGEEKEGNVNPGFAPMPPPAFVAASWFSLRRL